MNRKKNKKTKRYEKMNLKSSMLIRVLYQEFGICGDSLISRFPQFSRRTIYRHATSKKLSTEDGRKNNPGRPKKLDKRDERNILRTLKRLRLERASFSAKKIQEEARILNVSTKTIHRILHKYGYKYRQSRKKGLLYPKDKKNRLKFSKTARNFEKGFWEKRISFYFDGVGFAHKFNPFAEAVSTSSMAWRLPGEGLEITTKGKKEGSGGKMANFFVAISHGRGVVLCKQYPWTVTGERFAGFIRNVFPSVFEKCDVQPSEGLWLQDGDPRQNSKKAKEAWEELGCSVFNIPARSPDLNPIENIFHIVRERLTVEALELGISHESYTQFSKRVAKTISQIPVWLIDKTIESMPKRLEMVIKQKGGRTKY